MSTDFEWRFGDEIPEETVGKGQPQSGLWRRWLLWGLVLLLASSSACVWWRQRQRTLDGAEDQVQQIARLELRAQTEGDTELYMSLQDSANRAWRQAQATYTKTAGLPLPIQGLTTTQTSVQGARVVADRAEVDVVHEATLPDGRRASFQAVRVFRYTEDGRWLHTQVDPVAGGKQVIFTGAFVELTAFERDADWVEPLMSRLEDVTYEFCDLVSCHQDLPAALDLTVGLDGAAAKDARGLLAPFLVGAPQDEAAREAWGATLQAVLLDYLIAHETDRQAEDVAGELFEDRLHTWFSAKLGIDRGILADVNTLDDALARVSRSDSWIPLWDLYWVPVHDPRRSLAEAQVDLLFDFLERDYGPSAVAGLIRAFGGDDYARGMLGAVIDEPWSEFEWRYFAYIREATAEQVDNLAAFPLYDVVTGCRGPVGALLELRGLRLDQPATTLLSAGSRGGPLLPIAWSPDGTYLLLRDQSGDEMYSLLAKGSSTPRPFRELPADAEAFLSWTDLGETGWSPDGSHLAYRVPGQSVSGGTIDMRTGEHLVFDGDFVGWSPDGSRLVYGQPVPWHWSPELRVKTFWVWDREGDQPQRLGQGYTAAWSPDGVRIAYVTPEPALRDYHWLTQETVTLLDKAYLRQTLDFTPTLSPISGRPFEVDWSPTGEWIALGVTRSLEGGSEETLTLLVRDSNHRVLRRQDGGLMRVSWSPDGRWLATFTFNRNQSRVVVSDVQGDLLFEGRDAFISWSPEGRYMALVQSRLPLLRVLEVESGTWQVFEVPGNCWPIVWNPLALLDQPTREGKNSPSRPERRGSVHVRGLMRCQP